MRVHPRTIKSTKQVSFWLGKLNFWTNIAANPKTKCLSTILGHVESANYSIIRSRLSLLRRIKPYFNFDSSLLFITLVLTTTLCTLLIALLPGVTVPPSSVMSQFVCSFTDPTSLRRVRKLLRHCGGKTGQVRTEFCTRV